MTVCANSYLLGELDAMEKDRDEILKIYQDIITMIIRLIIDSQIFRFELFKNYLV